MPTPTAVPRPKPAPSKAKGPPVKENPGGHRGRKNGSSVKLQLNGALQPSESQRTPEEEIRLALKVFLAPDQVVEVRALGVRAGNYSNTVSGYFDAEHREDLIRDVLAIGEATGVYFVLNPVKPALLARAANRLRKLVGKDTATTGDADSLSRRWILIDLDPVRPSGISATAAEKALAWDCLLYTSDAADE